ncbi:MAG: hypothetical protein AAF799_10250 [Myxococcota bacterium]
MLEFRLCLLAPLLSVPLLACSEDNQAANTAADSDSGDSVATAAATAASTGASPTTAGSTTGVVPDDTDSVDTSGDPVDEPVDTTATIPDFVFDLGEIPDAPAIDEECGEVDFLFVIDNSGSMGDEQANLVANFPAFIDGIQNSLEDVESYHVGVVTTDAYSDNIAGCRQLSSLVVQTGGSSSSNAMCGPYFEGNNYMTEMDDLATAFSCAAQIGTSGDATERAMQAVVETVTGVEADPGECNFGFLREEALLVIVIITDEPDNTSLGTPMTWFDDVVAAKAGISENIVVLSLVNTPGGACPGGDANNMAAFTMMFGDNDFMADICAPDFMPVFNEAIGVIDVACENFIPPN